MESSIPPPPLRFSSFYHKGRGTASGRRRGLNCKKTVPSPQNELFCQFLFGIIFNHAAVCAVLKKGGVPGEGLDERAAGTGLAHAAWVFAGHAAVFVRLRRLVAHRRQGLARLGHGACAGFGPGRGRGVLLGVLPLCAAQEQAGSEGAPPPSTTMFEREERPDETATGCEKRDRPHRPRRGGGGGGDARRVRPFGAF